MTCLVGVGRSQLLCSVRKLTARSKLRKPTFCSSRNVGFFRVFLAFAGLLGLSGERASERSIAVLGVILERESAKTLRDLWVLGNSRSGSLRIPFFTCSGPVGTDGFGNSDCG